MDNLKDFFELEKNFSKYNKYISIIVAIYYGLIFIFGNYEEISEVIFGLLIICVLLQDIFAGSKEYWHKKYMFRIVKQIELFVVGDAMIHYGTVYMTVALTTILYLGIVCEYLFLYDIVEDYYRINAMMETTFPIIVISMIFYIFRGTNNFEVILAMAFIFAVEIILLSKLKVMANVIRTFLNNMYRQERIAINSREEYENLKMYQTKLVNANEQLSIQKFQLQQLNENISSKNNQMDLQYKILKHISSSLEIEKLTDFITSGIIDILNANLCIICVFETDETSGIKEKFCNIKYSEDSRIDENTMELFVKYIQNDFEGHFKEGYMLDNTIENGKYEFLEKSNILSMLIYPIDISENHKGVLLVGKNRVGYFRDNNIDFFKGIGEQIAVAVNNASMYLKMQDMATKDPLTSIFNRRYFNSIYPQFIAKAMELKKPLTVVLFDIDKFKNVNDKYGHLFGDKVIHFCGVTAGEVAEKNGGHAVRYGGEEFVIIFPDKNLDEISTIIEDMHKKIREHEFEFENSPVYINVSIGISSYPETCFELEELLNRADLSMYHSKNTGRGRITIDSSNVRGEE